jgi:SAM-dependent methyltransferase
VTTVGSTVPLDRLRAEVTGSPRLSALTGERYARTHAAYEDASDQRGRLREWVLRELPPLLAGRDPVRVVGVGVGDGSVDAPFAGLLAGPGRGVRYTGVEPHPPSALAFVGRLAALPAAALVPSVVIGDFADHDAGHPADLVHFLHSLYYVDDLAAALAHACAIVRPGGLVVAATAPREPLCVLTELLCPWERHRPWFAADVQAEMDLRGLDVRVETLVGRLDVADVLADPLGRGEDVFDFLVGARTRDMSPHVRAEVLGYLTAICPDGVHVPHPLDVVVARVP